MLHSYSDTSGESEFDGCALWTENGTEYAYYYPYESETQYLYETFPEVRGCGASFPVPTTRSRCVLMIEIKTSGILVTVLADRSYLARSPPLGTPWRKRVSTLVLARYRIPHFRLWAPLVSFGFVPFFAAFLDFGPRLC